MALSPAAWPTTAVTIVTTAKSGTTNHREARSVCIWAPPLQQHVQSTEPATDPGDGTIYRQSRGPAMAPEEAHHDRLAKTRDPQILHLWLGCLSENSGQTKGVRTAETKTKPVRGRPRYPSGALDWFSVSFWPR